MALWVSWNLPELLYLTPRKAVSNFMKTTLAKDVGSGSSAAIDSYVTLGNLLSLSGPCSPNSSERGQSLGEILTPSTPYSRRLSELNGVGKHHWCLFLCLCLTSPHGRLGILGYLSLPTYFLLQSFASSVPSAWNFKTTSQGCLPHPTHPGLCSNVICSSNPT